MRALQSIRGDANKARSEKRPEKRRELMISIGLSPEEDEGAEQEMGDEGEMMEGDAGIPGGALPSTDIADSTDEGEPDEDDLMMRRRR